MLSVYLLRHGQTPYNADGDRYCGHTDIELTERGIGLVHGADRSAHDRDRFWKLGAQDEGRVCRGRPGVVGHNGVNRLYMAHKPGIPPEHHRRLVQENSAITLFELDDRGEFTLQRLNA